MDQSALSRKVDPQEAAMKKAADELARFDPIENNILSLILSKHILS